MSEERKEEFHKAPGRDKPPTRDPQAPSLLPSLGDRTRRGDMPSRLMDELADLDHNLNAKTSTKDYQEEWIFTKFEILARECGPIDDKGEPLPSNFLANLAKDLQQKRVSLKGRGRDDFVKVARGIIEADAMAQVAKMKEVKL